MESLYNGDAQTASISITKYENTLLEDTDYTCLQQNILYGIGKQVNMLN